MTQGLLSFFRASRAFAFFLWILWMGVIFSFSTMSGQVTEGPPPLWYFLERKSAHVFEYAMLMLLTFHYFQLTFRRETRIRIAVLSVLFSLMYGATDELHQFFVPFRGAMMTDVLIDGIGVMGAAVLILLFSPKKNRLL